MAKNKNPLLKESAVRRFMKLAELNDLSDHFVGQNYITEEEEEMEMDVKLDDDDMGTDDVGDEPEAEVTPEEAEVIVALGDRLKASGVTGEGGDDMDDMDDDDDEPVDMDDDDDEPVDMDDDEDDDMEDLEEMYSKKKKMYEDDDEDDVQLESLDVEVLDDSVLKEALYKRVVQRLAETSKKRKLAESRKRKSATRDALVERILARITSESK